MILMNLSAYICLIMMKRKALSELYVLHSTTVELLRYMLFIMEDQHMVPSHGKESMLSKQYFSQPMD